MTFEFDTENEDDLGLMERVTSAVRKPPQSSNEQSPPFNRQDCERQLLEAYEHNPHGFKWWERTALHKRIFGRHHYSAAALYLKRSNLIAQNGDRFVITQQGRDRLAELRAESETDSAA